MIIMPNADDLCRTFLRPVPVLLQNLCDLEREINEGMNGKTVIDCEEIRCTQIIIIIITIHHYPPLFSLLFVLLFQVSSREIG